MHQNRLLLLTTCRRASALDLIGGSRVPTKSGSWENGKGPGRKFQRDESKEVRVGGGECEGKMAPRLRIVSPRRSTFRVVSDRFFNVRTGLLFLVFAYCCLKASELGDRRTEVSKLLSNIGLEEYEDKFAMKGYFSVDDVLTVSTSELMEDIGFESRILASKVKNGAFRSRRGDFLSRSIFYFVLVFIGFSAAMCILSQNFRKAAAEMCILIILLTWSFGRKQYRQFHTIDGVPAEILVEEEMEATESSSRDRGKKRKKIEKVKNYLSCCFSSRSPPQDVEEEE